MKYLIIDERMREIEKQTLRNLGYKLIQLEKSKNVYEEISAHADIFLTKIKDELIIEKSRYETIKNQLPKMAKIIEGASKVKEKYPEDIKYNVCIVGNRAIHNFKYTDKKILEKLQKEKFELIHVNQGYTKCSIAVLNDNSLITTDIGIYNTLKKYDFDILFIKNNLDIKLLKENQYSKMNGFIGGTISNIDNKIFISGDLNKIDIDNKIRNFIKNKGLQIIDFKDLDIVDYGRNVYLLRISEQKPLFTKFFKN